MPRPSSRTWRSSRPSGRAGMAALERLRASLPADLPVIADAKRGDIGSTAARQATALFDQLGADAVTVNPYLGAEAVATAARAQPTGSRTCCAGRPTPGRASSRTSKSPPTRPPTAPRSGSTSASPAWPPAGDPAARSASWSVPRRPTSSRGSGRSPRAWRSSCPASAPRVVRSSPSSNTDRHRSGQPRDQPGHGLLVNVSRGIAGAASASGEGDPFERVRAAAAEWAARLPVLP